MYTSANSYYNEWYSWYAVRMPMETAIIDVHYLGVVTVDHNGLYIMKLELL